jgi:hypothetical protein
LRLALPLSIRALGLAQPMIVMISFATLKQTASHPLSLNASGLQQPMIVAISLAILKQTAFPPPLTQRFRSMAAHVSCNIFLNSLNFFAGGSKLCHSPQGPTKHVIFTIGVMR